MSMLLNRSIAIFTFAVLASSQSAFGQTRLEAKPSQDNRVGPTTEQRFPPLVVPDGFKATLFACDPLIEYPSAMAIGPRSGTLFLAHDYMTGLGLDIVRRDEVRLLEDRDKDGYADSSTVFAKGFNSIQGLAFYDDTVFVMHAPILTSLRDVDGDGIADQRRDLITGLGLAPEDNPNRLHCANGVTAGHDGWLYLALGDRGCDVKRPEGDRLVFRQGGILRCRFDGTDLHVFSTGLRNIYDVALDNELNVFVRDNENDGGDYMIRVCHCFFGSDHGYPYHYYERPDELMPPLADLGRGSSAGGTSYLETAFPPEFQNSLFFCEWGRAVVRYRQSRAGSSFEEMTEIDFAAGSSDDPYGFKPTDLVVDYDGSLLISDWADGQRPKRGRGRIYRVSYTHGSEQERKQNLNQLGTTELIKALDSASYQLRVAAQLKLEKSKPAAARLVSTALLKKDIGPIGRMHGVWIIAHSGTEAIKLLLEIAESDDDLRVRSQAIRAIGDLADPILNENKVDAGRGDPQVADQIARIAEATHDPRIILESIIVLGRLRWYGTADWISKNLRNDEPPLSHAASQTLRRAQDWPGVTAMLDGPPRLRRAALHAMAEQRVAYIVNELTDRLRSEPQAMRRREYADALSRIVRSPAPWEYWGFRPGPRQANTVDWEMTVAIVETLNDLLADSDLSVREFVLSQMTREGADTELSKLVAWLREDNDELRVSHILKTLGSHEPTDIIPVLVEAVLRRTLPAPNRIMALGDVLKHSPEQGSLKLLEIAHKLEDGAVLGAVLRECGRRPNINIDDLLFKKLESNIPLVRAEAIRSLGLRKSKPAKTHVKRLLRDDQRVVRLAAAETAGLLDVSDVAQVLIEMAASDDIEFVNVSLKSLRLMQDGRALAEADVALDRSATQMTAIAYMRELGGVSHLEHVVQTAATNLSLEFQREVAQTLRHWEKSFPTKLTEIHKALAIVNGDSGQPFIWRTSPVLDEDSAAHLLSELHTKLKQSSTSIELDGYESRVGDQAGAILDLNQTKQQAGVWIAWSPVWSTEEASVELLTSATDDLSVWLNGARVHRRTKPAAFRPDSDRVPVTLQQGMNTIAVRIGSKSKKPRFQLRFRRRSSEAEHERLTQLALKRRGNPGRGRELFENVKKAACIQCHRLGQKGGNVGPDLSGVGRRFSRVHLIESILDPSRSVAPSYSTIVVALNCGRILSGVRLSETRDMIIIGDNQGKSHEILKADIDEISVGKESTMPGGLDKTLTDQEFFDLLSFLESQKTEP